MRDYPFPWYQNFLDVSRAFQKTSLVADMCFNCNSTVVDLYADDTTFYDFQSDIEQLETNLQLTLNSLQEWCRQNGMVINTEKKRLC